MSVVENSIGKEETFVEDKEKKYVNYLQTITAVSLATVALEGLLFIVHRPAKAIITLWGKTVNLDFCFVSIVSLVVVAVLALAFSTEWQFYESIDNFINGRRKDHAVTALFFFHMILVALYIFQDSGVKSSCISNILLLDTCFGYFFSSKVKIKVFVSLLCLFLYSILFIFYFDQGEFQHGLTIDIVPYILAILFVFGFNGIIYKRIIKEALEQKQKS